MWSKHGARDIVLKVIDKCIPQKLVTNKIMVIDSYADLTYKSAIDYGWKIIINEGEGISGASNTALKYVESEYFISFEDDVLLAKNWWDTVPPLLFKEQKVAVASGVRVPTNRFLKSLHLYGIKRAEKLGVPYLMRSIDNTIYKTQVIRKLGGFPKLPCSSGVDTALAWKIHDAGYKWLVNTSTVSLHIRQGIKAELSHNYWYGKERPILKKTLKHRVLSFKKQLQLFLTSPYWGFKMALCQKEPFLCILYLSLIHI